MMKPRNDRITMTLFAALFALLFAGCPATSKAAEQQDVKLQPRGASALNSTGRPPFKFVVLGDARPGTKAEPAVSWSASIHYMEHILWINRIGPDFTVNVGDSIIGAGRKTIEKQWDAFDKAGQLFKEPYFMVVGNHDASDAYAAGIYQRRYGPLYYSFDHKECHFTALSTEVPKEWDTIGPEQLKWLEKDLEGAQNARWRFVFMHRPLWSPLSHFMVKNKPEEINREWMSNVHQLLLKRKVDTVFAGHDHLYEFDEIDGIRYIITGGAGAELNASRALGGFHHFLKVSVPTEGRPEIKVVERGEEYPQEIAPHTSRAKVEEIRQAFKFSSITAGQEPQFVTLSISNAFEKALTFSASWKAGNPVSPAATNVTIEPRQKRDATFTIDASAPDITPLSCRWSLKLGDNLLVEEKSSVRIKR